MYNKNGLSTSMDVYVCVNCLFICCCLRPLPSQEKTFLFNRNRNIQLEKKESVHNTYTKNEIRLKYLVMTHF